MNEEQKAKHLIRVANTDLIDIENARYIFSKIPGIDFMFSNMVCKIANVEINKKAGLLNTNEVTRINEVIANPEKYNVPSWMMNRRKDYETGKDKHIITGDLQYIKQQDLRRLKKIKSYRGLRHQAGLPLRGQRTKSNFRRNKGKAVGVKRKKGAKSGRV